MTKALIFHYLFRRFVAHEEVQLFTSEVKNKMSTRSIVQAIEEICTEFEELQQKSSCPSRVDTSKSPCDGRANLSPTFSDKKGDMTSNSLKELALASSPSYQSIEECPKGKNAEDRFTDKVYSRNPGRGCQKLADEQETVLSKNKSGGQDKVQNFVNLAGDTSSYVCGKQTADVLRNKVVSGENKTIASSDESGDTTEPVKGCRKKDIGGSSGNAKLGSVVVKGSAQPCQVENLCTPVARTIVASIVSGGEESKCHQRGLKAMSSFAPPHTKRKVVCLYDNDNKDIKTPVHVDTSSFLPVPVKRRYKEPKTPVHRGSIKQVSTPYLSGLQKSNITYPNSLPAQTLMDLGRVQDGSSNEVIPYDKLLSNVIQDEVAVCSDSVPTLASGNLNSSQVQSTSENDKTALSGERKITLNPTSQMNNSVLAAGNPMEIVSLASTRYLIV